MGTLRPKRKAGRLTNSTSDATPDPASSASNLSSADPSSESPCDASRSTYQTHTPPPSPHSPPSAKHAVPSSEGCGAAGANGRFESPTSPTRQYPGLMLPRRCIRSGHTTPPATLVTSVLDGPSQPQPTAISPPTPTGSRAGRRPTPSSTSPDNLGRIVYVSSKSTGAPLGWGKSDGRPAKRIKPSPLRLPAPVAVTSAPVAVAPVVVAPINALPADILVIILYWVTSPEEKPERSCRRLDLHQLQRVGHPNYLLVCKHWFVTAYSATWREVILRGPAHAVDQQLKKVREHKKRAEKRLASAPFRTNDVLMAWDGRIGDADIAVLQNLHKDLLVRPESLVINLKRASAGTPLYPPVLSDPTFHCLTRLHIESNKHLVVRDLPPKTKLRCNLVSFYISAYRDAQTNEELIRAVFASSAESLLEVGIGYSNDRHPDAVVLRDCLVRAKRVEKVAFSSELLQPVLAVLPTLPALATLELNGYAKLEEIERLCAPRSTPPTLESLTVRPFAGDLGHPAGGGRRINKDRYGAHVDPERKMLGHLARSIETGGNLGALKKLKLLSDEELDLATGDGKDLMDVCKRKEIKVTERVWNCFDT